MAYKTIFASIIVAALAYLTVRYQGGYGIFELPNKMLQVINDIMGKDREVNQRPTVNFGRLELATIDMTEAKVNSKEAVTKLYQAFSKVGFAYLVNIPDFEPDLLLKYTKWYFDLPLEVKMKMAKQPFRQENENVYRGYYPVIPGGHSFKEAFEMGSFFEGSMERRVAPGTKRPLMRDVVQEVNVWPVSGNETADLEFKEFMIKMYNFYADVAKEVTQLVAKGLGLSSNYFESFFGPKQLSTLRLLHYPTRINDTDVPEEAKDGDVHITTGEHHDSSFLTVLATFESQGLQVKLSDDEPWLNIPSHKNGLIVNVGALLTQLVDGQFKATNHRVIDLGTDRYSVPLFYEMQFDGDVSKSISGKIINAEFPKYGPWMTNRTSMFAEYATTDFGIAD